MTIAAAILAGGRGERMGGVDKSQLVVGGAKMIDRLGAVLERQAEPLLCVRRDRVEAMAALPAGMIGIFDLETEFGGPLAGIAAAVDWLQRNAVSAEFLLTVAVDTPFFPPSFAARMMAAMDAATDAVIARYNGQIYPTNGLWRLASIADLPERVLAATAPKGPRFLAEALRTVYLDWFPQEKQNPFANANTLSELIILNERTQFE